MRKRITLSIVGLFVSILSYTQAIDRFVHHADSIFSVYDNPQAPGVVAGVIKDDKVMYLKGFGSANMETDELISPKTKFQLGELSKQFASLAVLVAEEQDAIELDDDIRKYLPELPEYAHKVTIRHLLNHSSGLFDIGRINTILNGSPVITSQVKAIEMVAAQEKLSFQPGTEFSFHESVTESVLMAEIIARSTGLSFPEFVKTKIFEPLEMNNSLIRDDSEFIINGVAEAYRKEENEDYKKNEVRSNVIGAINAYSSAEDMTKWYVNFTAPKGSLGQMIKRLDTPVQLSNGKEFNYYWGKMTIGREFGHPERGLPIYWTYGLQGGYGSNVFRFKNEKITSFVFGNNDEYNGSLAMDVINFFVKDNYLLPAAVDYTALKTVKMNSTMLKSFEGNYWFQPAGYASKIYVENDTLRSKWLFTEKGITLVPISDDTFQQVGSSDEVRQFKFVKGEEGTTLYFKYNDSNPDIMKTYVPFDPSAEMLQSYLGTYYNKAYRSLILLDLKDGQLVARNQGHNEIVYRSVKKDVFTSATLFIPSLAFVRDKSNEITGIKIDGDGVHSLVYDKVD